MPRGARLSFQNSFYHVFNRGINKQQIFFSDNDYLFFLGKLKAIQSKYDHSIYAFCLMPNHFHISVHTRKVPISKIMSSLTTSYSMYFNRTYSHFGPVFQNRYKSVLVENDGHFRRLSQYIYLNPLRARLITDPVLYRFSSIREAIGKEPLNFLDKDIIRLIGDTNESRNDFEKFVYEGATDDFAEISNLFEKEEATLGNNRFATLAQKKYMRRQQKLR
jgi:putative transposase